MRIGCNWSAALKDLLLDKKIDVDYIKAGVFGSMEKEMPDIAAMRPVLLHGLGYSERMGMKDISIVDFSMANRYIKLCRSPHYGVHLSVKNSDLDEGMTDEEIDRRIISHIRVFKHNISVPLLLENVPDSLNERTVFDHYPYVDAGRLRRVLNETGTGLLLDLTHAKITAKYRGWDTHAYLLDLPLHLVREIHVNGSGVDTDGFPEDTHQSMAEEDYELLEWVLGHTDPHVVTLEYIGVKNESYDKVTDNLLKQINRIQKLTK